MKHITQLEYDLIKVLQGSVKSQPEASRLTGRSQPTVSAVWRSKNYDEYVGRYKKPTPAPVVTVQTPQDKVNQLLLNIADTQMQILNSQKAMAENIQFLAENMPIESRSKLRIFGR